MQKFHLFLKKNQTITLNFGCEIKWSNVFVEGAKYKTEGEKIILQLKPGVPVKLSIQLI